MVPATSTPLDIVIADIDARAPALLDELRLYVSVPSVSAEGSVRAAGEYVAERARRWGFRARILETGGQPAVLLEGPSVPGAPRVLAYGHYDVQAAGDRDLWTYEPFDTTVVDGRIYGRGTADNKGQHLAYLLAAESWIRLTGGLPCNLTVLLDGEEELGSPHLAALVADRAEELACDLVLWSDGPVHESGRATINFGVRGIVQFELRAAGAHIDLHSGNWGGVAPSPAWRLVHLLASMRDQLGHLTIDGLTDGVRPLSASERTAIDAMPVDEEQLRALGIQVLDEPRERPFYERLAAHPTLTINRIEAGGTGPDRTVIPCVARAVCDVRLVDAMTVEDTLACIAAHVRRHAPDITFTPRSGMEPSRTDLDSPYVPPIRRALRRIQGEDPYLVPAMGGSLPDYVFTKILGVPSIGVPFANADEANHAPDENIELQRFLNGPKIVASMLAELAAADARP